MYYLCIYALKVKLKLLLCYRVTCGNLKEIMHYEQYKPEQDMKYLPGDYQAKINETGKEVCIPFHNEQAYPEYIIR